MKRIWLILAVISIVLITCLIYSFSNHKSNNRKTVKNIENFSPSNIDGDGDFYLLYPSDARVSQDFTLAREVTVDGKVVQEYEIIDEDFRRALIHQKPNEIDNLYISLFGEPVVQNWFYTYDINKQKFKKVDINYFNYDVGVDHIKHYGTDVLFQTLVSHKTGTQNVDEATGDFNVSISIFTTEKSYETEYGYEPIWSPILQFNNEIIYSVGGLLNEDGVPVNSSIALINRNDGKIKYVDFDDDQTTEYFPLYSTDTNAYILGNEGKLFVLDKQLDYKIYEPFKSIEEQTNYYDIDGTLLLNEKVALHILYNDQIEKATLGVFSFDTEPSFIILNKDYIREHYRYKILYQDKKHEEIYIVESDEKGNGNLLIINNQSLDVKNKIPIKYAHLLDMVIKKDR